MRETQPHAIILVHVLFLFPFLLLINCMRAQELKQTHKRKPPKAPEHTLQHLSRSSIFWREHILPQGGWASANLMYTKGAPVFGFALGPPNSLGGPACLYHACTLVFLLSVLDTNATTLSKLHTLLINFNFLSLHI